MLKKSDRNFTVSLKSFTSNSQVSRIALHDTTLTSHDTLRELLSKVHDHTQQENEQAEVTKGETDDKDFARLINVSNPNVLTVSPPRGENEILFTELLLPSSMK